MQPDSVNHGLHIDANSVNYVLRIVEKRRETFFANQLASAGHTVEYAGYKKGDFRIDGNTVIEVGGEDKGFSQLSGQEHAFVAADDIEFAYERKIPLWAFGFLY